MKASLLMKISFVARVFFSLLLTSFSLLAQEMATPSVVAPTEGGASVTNTATTVAPDITTPSCQACSLGSGASQHEKTAVSGEGHSSIKSYCSVPVDGPYIAMTFDDGPSTALTPRLLDLLKQRGIKVTFFVIGQNVEHAPEIVARAAAEGHEIGNHTWDHPPLTKLSDARAQEEINKTSEAIFNATGKKPVLLRPPYGAVNPRISHLIDQDGMKVVLWSVDPNDWKRPGAAVVERRILAGAKPGAIILSHDIHPGTVEAMPATLDALLAKGYKFVTVSELMAMESQHPKVPVVTGTPSAVAPKGK